jgi:hypothetical protein
MTFRSFRRLAGLLALAAMTAAIFIAWRGSNRPIVLNQSLVTFAAIVVSFVAAAGFGRLFFLDDFSEARFQLLVDRWRAATPIQGHVGLCFIVAVLSMSLHGELAHQQRPFKFAEYVDDEVDYQRVAKEIGALPGGVGGLLPALFRGEFAEDNRHPLYPAILAAGNQFRIDDRPLLLKPILLSTSFGLFVVLATCIVAWKMFSPAVGALSAFLVAVNGAMIQSSSLIACETLLVLLTTLGWYAFSASSTPMTWSRALLIGGLFGLAYLTKASALFPLLIMIALTTWRRANKPRWLAPTMMTLAFVVVATPLLSRNVVRYHNPLHSFNNKLLFAESYESGIAEPDLGTFGNLKRYLGRHTVKEIVVDRFLSGVMWEGFVLLRSLGPWPFDSGRVLFGAVFLVAALIGMTTAISRKLSPTFLILWAGWFLLFFGWYQPIASGDRFLLPLIPPLTIAASLGISCVLRAVFSSHKNPE